MKTIIILAFVVMLSMQAKAEVFKCKSSENKITYQTTPCVGAADVKKIEIKKRSAEKEAEEAAKLEAWTAQHNAEEEREATAAKELRDEELRAAEVAAQQINADAQIDQAEAQRRQAKALENANRPMPFIPYPAIINPRR